ncbi:hypothetical protein PVAND_014271 [Polypedilum vanderplanki]|uniref:Uncharacterized protein n=1 Tax=Polypedilum vanderplanki TaxID=319348 RepID=A0A9J6CTF7_POLVA|nr:hypothetical protein PVAND_014271 [Polypedilum vanderplanki]
MKFLVFCLFALIVAIKSNVFVKNPIENERYARIILENSRVNFECGWPNIGENGIPPIDPFLIDDWTLNQIQTDRRIEYIFTVEQMYMTGTHFTRGKMNNIPVVNGNGPMVAHMKNSRYHGFIFWSTYPGSDYMYVSDQTMIAEIESMNMTMTDFGVLDNMINQQINDQLPEMIVSEQFQQQMNDMFSKFIVPLVDSFIYMETPQTIGDVLAHYAANPRPPQC